jgi:HEPN domain-containing protein
MMTKEEHIRHWLEQSKEDWSVVETLFSGKKYLHSLFFAHLVIEKISKALWIKHNSENMAPRTHNINFLLSATPVELSDEQREFLLYLNRFQLEGRYPDYMTNIAALCTEAFTKDILDKAQEIRECLVSLLQ